MVHPDPNDRAGLASDLERAADDVVWAMNYLKDTWLLRGEDRDHLNNAAHVLYRAAFKVRDSAAPLRQDAMDG